MNEYEVTYSILRKRIVDDTYIPNKQMYLTALDAAYAQRAPIPFGVVFVFGDPLAKGVHLPKIAAAVTKQERSKAKRTRRKNRWH